MFGVPAKVTTLAEADKKTPMSLSFLESLKKDWDPVQKWMALIQDEKFKKAPFAVQNQCFQEVYKNWISDKNQAPPPAWVPSQEDIQNSNIQTFSKRVGINNSQNLHDWSVKNRQLFWNEVVSVLGIKFHKPFESIMGASAQETSPQWLPGAKMNIAESCFTAKPNQAALVFQKENGQTLVTSYKELKEKSLRVASALRAFGVKKGEAVAIDMPMTELAVEIYLGIILSGAAVVSIADSFAPDEIATRIRISKAVLIFTQDQITRSGKSLPLYSKVCEATTIPAIVVKTLGESLSLRSHDTDYLSFLKQASGELIESCSPMEAVNILFSSGTTGDPKAIVWNHTTPIKCGSDGYFHHDIHEGDVVAWPTNLGWMMGPWLLFATFLNKGTVAIHEGAPLGRDFGEFVVRQKVTVLGLVPSIVKAWRNSNCMEGLDWSSLKLFSSTGECSNTEDYLYLMSLAHFRPIIEYCGGTEIGGGFLTGNITQNASPATFTTPAMGINVEVVNEGLNLEVGEGELFVVPPSMGLSTQLLNKDHHEVYFKNAPRNSDGVLLRKHGDQMEKLPGGYFRALGRADDTMNLGGIKVSSAEIERALVDVPGVLETAAVAVNPPGGGPSLLKIFYVLNKSQTQVSETELKALFQKAITKKLNPLFKVHDLKKLESLPRTASNKIMRRLLR